MPHYFIKKHPFWKRWYVQVQYYYPDGPTMVCQWCTSWDDAIGYVQSVYGWQW